MELWDMWLVAIFMLGAIVGSFLNVLLYRMHTGASLGGRSHCMSCGKTLSWYELVPIVSYLMLRGACRGCSAYIPVRYLTVELITGAAFVGAYVLHVGEPLYIVFTCVLFASLIVTAVYDIRHMVIPNECVLAVLSLALLSLIDVYVTTSDMNTIIRSLIAGGVASGAFYALWFVSKGRWIGFGDVKLAFPLGVLVGISGVFSMLVLSFWVGALVSVLLLGFVYIVKRGKHHLRFPRIPITMKSEIPFAPFLIAGFLLVYVFHANILTITEVLFF